MQIKFKQCVDTQIKIWYYDYVNDTLTERG